MKVKEGQNRNGDLTQVSRSPQASRNITPVRNLIFEGIKSAASRIPEKIPRPIPRTPPPIVSNGKQRLEKPGTDPSASFHSSHDLPKPVVPSPTPIRSNITIRTAIAEPEVQQKQRDFILESKEFAKVANQKIKPSHSPIVTANGEQAHLAEDTSPSSQYPPVTPKKNKLIINREKFFRVGVTTLAKTLKQVILKHLFLGFSAFLRRHWELLLILKKIQAKKDRNLLRRCFFGMRNLRTLIRKASHDRYTFSRDVKAAPPNNTSRKTVPQPLKPSLSQKSLLISAPQTSQQAITTNLKMNMPEQAKLLPKPIQKDENPNSAPPLEDSAMLNSVLALYKRKVKG